MDFQQVEVLGINEQLFNSFQILNHQNNLKKKWNCATISYVEKIQSPYFFSVSDVLSKLCKTVF